MVVIKKCGMTVSLALATIAVIALGAGCGAPGPRALLKGEDLIKEKRYAEAIEPLQTAARLLPRNAQALNHLGIAYHGAGQFEQAQRAYKQALNIDFHLAAVRYNLGLLALEHNDAASALEHLTSYTVFEPNSPDGWIKLANAQVRLRRLDHAEKSYKTALDLRPRDPEALNGLGNVAYHRRKPTEALSFFGAALAENAKYAPAVLNVAVVHQSQNNRQQALQEFKQYAALAPTATTVDAVNAIIEQLEAEVAPAQPVVAITPPPRTNTSTLPPPPSRQAPTSAPPSIAITPRTSSPPAIAAARGNQQSTRTPAPAPATGATARATPPTAKTSPVEITQLEDDLVVKPVHDVPPGTRTPTVTTQANAAPSVEGNANTEEKKGLFEKLNPFNRTKPPATETQVAAVATAPVTNIVRAPAPAPAPSFPRYRYSSPSAPKSGNRREAERHFTQGASAQRSGSLAQAVAKYQQATEIDPAYFEAYYNLGLAAYDLGKWRQSLSAYELALALKPASLDTRYNFALALKQAGHPLDAAEELKAILKANPSELRAHLSLGNLYAQQLAQPDLARRHYLKVLEAQPNHPKASEIRYWLASNPA